MPSELKNKFENYLIVNRFALKTQKAYLGCIKDLARYHRQSPDRLSNDQVQDYLVHLIKQRGLSWSSCNVAFCALTCFYHKFLDRKLTEIKIPRRPRQKKLPEIFSRAEVGLLIENAKDLRSSTLLMMVYGSGLRVSEVVRLQHHHIESERMMLRVEQSKARKDRYTLLSKKALEQLRFYYKIHRPGTYLFSGRIKDEPLPIASAQHMYDYAKDKAGLNKGRGIHTLRHCFATHLLMQGVDIQLIKEFLGHKSIETTLVYLHMMPERVSKIKSPLDADE